MRLSAIPRRSVLVLIGVLALFVSTVWVANSRADAAAASATPVVYIVTGENFPDALGVGPASALARGPILFVTHDSIPGPTKTELSRLRPDRIIVVGGTAVISPSVESQLGAWAPVTRIAGANRYETAALVSKAAFPASVATAAAAGALFATPTSPITLSDGVWTELGSMAVTIPAGGGVVKTTSTAFFESPIGTSGGFVLITQMIDHACSELIATSLGTGDVTASAFDVVALDSAGSITAGTHTIRFCAKAFQLYSWETTSVNQSDMSAVWTPAAMGPTAFSPAAVDTVGLSTIEASLKARATALREAAPPKADG